MLFHAQLLGDPVGLALGEPVQEALTDLIGHFVGAAHPVQLYDQAFGQATGPHARRFQRLKYADGILAALALARENLKLHAVAGQIAALVHLVGEVQQLPAHKLRHAQREHLLADKFPQRAALFVRYRLLAFLIGQYMPARDGQRPVNLLRRQFLQQRVFQREFAQVCVQLLNAHLQQLHGQLHLLSHDLTHLVTKFYLHKFTS